MLNEIAPRRIAVLDPLKLVIDNWPRDHVEECFAPNHPQKPDWGKRMIPMTNEPVRTKITGPDGELAFQEYMVRLRTELDVRSIRFAGIESATPAPGVLEAITGADAIFIAPSNPFVSIGPILAVPGIRAALETTNAARVAISPIIAGQVVKGPAAKMMTTLGYEVSALGVAKIYAGLIDCFVIDNADRELAPAVEALGLRCLVTDTMMTSMERKAELAAEVVEAARAGR